MYYIYSLSRDGCLGPKTGATHNHVQCKTKVVQSKGWFSSIVCYSRAKINYLWDGYDKRKVSGLVPSCGQDGYTAKVPQHSIDSY